MNIQKTIQKTVAELLSTGLTQQELADLAQCSQSAINALLHGHRGTRLSFDLGQSLMTLHKERFGRRQATPKSIPSQKASQ